ncbi:MAG: hypothetical protein NT022_13345 [Deltaproteobacteria bacterium]|nr:hypothetical protein [Deltaproteobacteria bacterium]
MRFIADQDVYWLTIKALREWGHEVTTARDLGMQKLTFLKEKISTGIIFLRCSPTNLDPVHKELRRLLLEHDEAELKCCFSVVETNRYRLRRLGVE